MKGSVVGIEVKFNVGAVTYGVSVEGKQLPFALGDRLVNLVTQNHEFLFGQEQDVEKKTIKKIETGGEAFGNEDVVDVVTDAELVEPDDATEDSLGGGEETAEPAAEAEEVDYASFTRLKDLVAYLHNAGYPHYTDIYTACTELIAGDLCPMLSKISNLESRLKTTCQAAGIPV